MPIDLSGILAMIALAWTAFQQFRINQICEKCPYFPPNTSMGSKGSCKI